MATSKSAGFVLSQNVDNSWVSQNSPISAYVLAFDTELLDFFIAFFLGICHSTRRYDQSALVFLKYEEYNQVAARVGSSHCSIDVFSGTVACFDEAEMRIVAKNLSDFILLNIVLAFQFVDDLVDPDDSADFQASLLSRAVPHNRRAHPAGLVRHGLADIRKGTPWTNRKGLIAHE